jgi:cytochrome P450
MYYSCKSNSIISDYGFGARPDIFAPLLGKGIFTQEGAAWKHSRELLRKQFIRAQYQNLDHFQEHIDNLIGLLPASGVVDLQPLFFSLTLDTTTALLLSRSVYSLRASVDQDAENRQFSESFNIAQEGLAKRFRIAPWHFLYNPPEFRKACTNVHRYVEQYIEKRQQERASADAEKSSYAFIDQIAEESGSVGGLRDQLLNVLLAGRDTTACCLSWTLYVPISFTSVCVALTCRVFPLVGCSSVTRRCWIDFDAKCHRLQWILHS